jgi:hypothetical protein
MRLPSRRRAALAAIVAAVASTAGAVVARTASADTVQVANASYNGRLTAGQSTSFGFQANGSGTGVTVSCAPT